MNKSISITEAPRDAMQGLKRFIPTGQKARLINALLKVGFDTIDFGSFVSPKAIPQLSDTAEVIRLLDMSNTRSQLMAIVGNSKGAERAADFDEISCVGFPFSFSETFLRLNINSTLKQACRTVEEIKEICQKKNKKLLVYLSMAFGNPYGDLWSPEMIVEWAKYLEEREIEIIALSDIIGVADGALVGKVIKEVLHEVRKSEIGLHLHTDMHTWHEKVDAAYQNGCRRFDGVMGGIGGCPMAGYELVGNLNTKFLIDYCKEKNIQLQLDPQAFETAFSEAVKTYAMT